MDCRPRIYSSVSSCSGSHYHNNVRRGESLKPYRWFTINMGTGIVSILLHNLPYNGVWLYWISVIFFVLNLALFVLFTFISALRYFAYPGLFMTMIRHPAVPLLLGAFPIALCTII